MDEEKKIQGRKNIALCIAAIAILCIILFPVFWIVVTSLKTEQEIFQVPPTILPKTWNVKSYAAQVENGDFNMFRSFGNSFLISLGAMAISVVLAVPASYGIAKYRFKGRKVMLLGFLVILTIALFILYARSDVTRSRSTFFSIGACAAAGMLLFQTCLNVFGVTDLLPLTGVTLPFISAGGSSMVSVWGLLAFLKASDERTYAARRSGRHGVAAPPPPPPVQRKSSQAPPQPSARRRPSEPPPPPPPRRKPPENPPQRPKHAAPPAGDMEDIYS